ncbi:MAG TPA: hypothetical protein VNF29_14725 [Candidatus Binataceae bacterium]|nr:hypothetical protein [Candidatus Binataceae bacterium]
MKKRIGLVWSVLGGVVLAVTLGSPAFAHPGKGKGGGNGGGESQAGGLPALEDRVDTLQADITTLQGQVSTLMGQVSTLTGEVGTLMTEVGDLQGQNNWAVVDSAGGTVFTSGPAGSITAEHVGTGLYEVTFAKDVSACAYEATIGATGAVVPAQGQISVSGNVDPDSSGDSDATADSNHNVYVQTFDKTGAIATDSPFHLYVSCP